MAVDLSRDALRQRASWIRDVQDPKIARDGPDSMQPDDVLVLHELFVALERAELTAATLRYSRIHKAVLEVAGKATRWPKRLAEECDRVIEVWERKHGKLTDVDLKLFGPGGRLHGVCTGNELTRDALLKYWSDRDLKLVDETTAKQHGALGFVPGQWWINGMFAFHAGIIDLACTDGGICANPKGAYAIVMKGSDEIYSDSPDVFRYRCRSNDPGRFRLTSADFRSRYPIRVLRSHTLSSVWAPRAGIRYDGLHMITGWTIKPVQPPDNDGYSIAWEICLMRDPSQDRAESSEEALKHPLAEEVDDYNEYKETRRRVRDRIRDDLIDVPATPDARGDGQAEDQAELVSAFPSPTSVEPSSFLGVPGLRDPTRLGPPTGMSSISFLGIPGLRGPVMPSPPDSPSSAKPVVNRPRSSTAFLPETERLAPSPSLRGRAKTQSLRKTLSTKSSLKDKDLDGSARRGTSQRTSRLGNGESIAGFATGDPSAKVSRTLTQSIQRMFDGSSQDDLAWSPFSSQANEPEESPLFTSQPTEMIQADGSRQPILNNPEWGGSEDSGDTLTGGAARNGRYSRTDLSKSVRQRRWERRMFETIARKEGSDQVLYATALDEIWDDLENPDYPDMVLEEPRKGGKRKNKKETYKDDSFDCLTIDEYRTLQDRAYSASDPAAAMIALQRHDSKRTGSDGASRRSHDSSALGGGDAAFSSDSCESDDNGKFSLYGDHPRTPSSSSRFGSDATSPMRSPAASPGPRAVLKRNPRFDKSLLYGDGASVEALDFAERKPGYGSGQGEPDKDGEAGKSPQSFRTIEQVIRDKVNDERLHQRRESRDKVSSSRRARLSRSSRNSGYSTRDEVD